MYKRLAMSMALAFSLPAMAQQAAHEHGVADLRVAADGNTVVIEFDSPLDNLVGFEHAPRDDAQRDALREAEERLASFDVLFALTPAAGCTLREVQIESPYPQGEDVHKHDDHDHKHDHGHAHAHDHGKKDDHAHSHDHGHKDRHGHGHDHAKKDDHAHSHDHAKEDRHAHGHDHKHEHDHGHAHAHADMYAVYELECQNVAALEQLEVRLIDVFPRISTLRVETATAAGQQSVRVREAVANVGL